MTTMRSLFWTASVSSSNTQDMNKWFRRDVTDLEPVLYDGSMSSWPLIVLGVAVVKSINDVYQPDAMASGLIWHGSSLFACSRLRQWLQTNVLLFCVISFRIWVVSLCWLNHSTVSLEWKGMESICLFRNLIPRALMMLDCACSVTMKSGSFLLRFFLLCGCSCRTLLLLALCSLMVVITTFTGLSNL
jgi:hypothetical protein